MNENYSIRESLQGKLQTYIRESGITSIPIEELLRDLVVLLSAYREEDTLYFPEVYVASDQQDLAPLLTYGVPIAIGTVPVGPDAAAKVLKECATLAVGNWAIFVFLDGVTFRYGVFRAVKHLLSTAADETLADLGATSKLMLVRNRGHQMVELQNTSKKRLTAAFRIASTAGSAMDAHINELVCNAVSELPECLDFKTYLTRLLTDALQHSHGTLLAVLADSSDVPATLKGEGVFLDPPIDLYSMHLAAKKLLDADSFSDLRSAEDLIRGMICSDGIVVFTPDGKLAGYRLFVRAVANELSRIPSEGGSRKRAYYTLKLRIPEVFCAALYRSQDGDTLCAGGLTNDA